MAGQIVCGTCAWGDHEDFYPSKVKPNERLAYYARYFQTVEVDSSFYAIPNPRVVERWAAQTPERFSFTMKVFKGMTGHERNLTPAERAAFFPRFREALEPMRAAGKLTAILLQFPPWYQLNRENVDYLRRFRAFFHDLTVATEFRHRSWFAETVRERTLGFLHEQELVNTIVDEPQVGAACIPLVPAVTDPKLSIVRFHGRNQDTWYIKDAKHAGERFHYLYSRAELQEWVPRIEALAEQSERVHLLLNNNFSNYAVQNALDLMELLGQNVTRPPLPGGQLELF